MTTDESEQALAASIPLLVLVGPTATGKTRLAVALSQRLPAYMPHLQLEAVSADSRQIYKWMDIATGKPSADERKRLPHHLLDQVEPDQTYTLAEYQADARAAIDGIWSRGGLPILVGGTGLYVRAVVDGLAIPEVPPDPALRSQLEEIAAREGASALYEQYSRLDPAGAARIDPRNTRRLIRALEVCLITGRPLSLQQGHRPTPYRSLFLGLNSDRTALYRAADERIDSMLARGLVEETRELLARGYGFQLPSMSGLGYREIGAYLREEMSLAAAVTRFKFSTHAYIRRQLTWFRPDARINWLDAGLPLDVQIRSSLAVIVPWLGDRGAPQPQRNAL